MNKKNLSRRTAIKSIGTLGLSFSSIGMFGATAAAKEYQTATVRELSNQDPEQIAEQPIENFHTTDSSTNGEAAVTAHAYNSTYYNGEWEHDFAFEAKAQSWGNGIFDNEIQAMKYTVEPNEGNLLTDNGNVGSLQTDDGIVPEWSYPLIWAGIGTVLTPVGIFQATGEALKEAYAPDTGSDVSGDGYEYNDDTWIAWNKAGHYGRFQYESNELDPVTVEASFKAAPTYEGIQMDVDVLKPDDCDLIGYCDSEEPGQLKEPTEMSSEEKDALGIKKVDENMVQSMDNPDEIRTSGGKIPEFISTKPPLTVSNIEQKTER